jgi:diketogulonate reductase-like aldo/keto reductase
VFANAERFAVVHSADYIDLFLMHSPLAGKDKRISTWRYLNEIMQEEGPKGRVRALGVSNLWVLFPLRVEATAYAG